MRIKVKGGTARSDEPSLCTTCRYATVIKGPRLRDEITRCTEFSPAHTIRFPVVSCSAYSDRRRPSADEMVPIAWVLRVDKKKNPIGFVRGSELSLEERRFWDD